MSQLTLRLPEELVGQLKQAAAAAGRSLNRWATDVLSAAVDPDLAGDEAERLRERLARAGLLVAPSGRRGRRPPADAVARARAAASRGTPLTDLISEGRG
jgi:plasmid stability protein